MFEIEKYETVNKTFRLQESLVKKLQKVAQEQNISMNNLVAQCCEYALKNLVPDSTPKDTKKVKSAKIVKSNKKNI